MYVQFDNIIINIINSVASDIWSVFLKCVHRLSIRPQDTAEVVIWKAQK